MPRHHPRSGRLAEFLTRTGSVTASWKIADGKTVSYSGSAGAKVVVHQSTPGKFDLKLSVVFAPKTAYLKAAAAAYSRAGRSTQNDAARLGIHIDLLQHHHPDDSLPGDDFRRWVHASNEPGGFGKQLREPNHGFHERQRVVGRRQLPGSGQRSEGLGYVGTAENLPLQPTADYAVALSPVGQIDTGCHTQGYGVSWNGIAFNNTESVCSGHFNTLGLSTAQPGGSWSGYSTGQQSIGFSAEVYSPPTATIGFVANEIRGHLRSALNGTLSFLDTDATPGSLRMEACQALCLGEHPAQASGKSRNASGTCDSCSADSQPAGFASGRNQLPGSASHA